ncbi:MAG: flavodoxin family protein [Clostridiales bacterium]|nr:flavodoxin family protein [Clostridiales bacterium]
MFIIITASPNTDGLTAACGKAAFEGITGAGGQAEIIDISAAKLEPCRICGDGWGVCRSEGKCIIDDILPEIQAKIRNCEGLFLITPVYWQQPSERMKYFLDRFRRCEAFKQEGGAAYGKTVDIVAAAGGSGNGPAQCIAEMEFWCRHVGAIPADRIGITRFTREPVMKAITDMGARLAKGEYFKRA